MPLPIQVTTGARTLVPGLIRTMSQEHLAQIELIWKGMLLTLQQPDKVWNWAYKLRLVVPSPLHHRPNAPQNGSQAGREQ